MPKFLADHEYLNADEIARGISPERPESVQMAAGRLLLRRIHELIDRDKSFAVETTCSGRSYIPLLQGCRSRGWKIALLYFWLQSPMLSIQRVAKRVSEGGHSIPPDVIYRRFRTGLRNMRHFYLPLAHRWQMLEELSLWQ